MIVIVIVIVIVMMKRYEKEKGLIWDNTVGNIEMKIVFFLLFFLKGIPGLN